MKRIIISRLDNIGDVILTFPLLYHLKSIYPESELIYIAKHYSIPVLENCKLVSDILEWETLNDLDADSLSSTFVKQFADIFINSTPNRKLARAAYQAKIPIRIGSARRLYHWIYCNKHPWVPDHRHCMTHMSDHFLSIARPLSNNTIPTAAHIPVQNMLDIKKVLPKNISSLLSNKRFNIIFHPGSNKHAPEWPTKHFLSLAYQLSKGKFNILLTGTNLEKKCFDNDLLSKLPHHVHDVMGQLDLQQFLSLIASVDGIVAASTGPIHVSGVLDKKTIGLFPPRTPNSFDWELTEHKWKPLGGQVTAISFDQSCNRKCTTETFASCNCMAAIKPSTVADIVHSWIT